LWQINPSVRVKIARTYLDKTNIANYFANCQIIFEAFDNVESKKMFLEHFLHSEKLVIFGNGMAGTNPIAELKITKLKENIILVGDNITNVNTQNPPLAPRVIACAAIMADVALQYILKRITNESIL
jgi:sulfur carrier protein ThiS adenylyltransferase